MTIYDSGPPPPDDDKRPGFTWVDGVGLGVVVLVFVLTAVLCWGTRGFYS